jgi:hypothetical protein
LIDYRAHPEAFFGEILPVCGKAETPYDMFKFFMDAYILLTRTQLLKYLGLVDCGETVTKSTEELRALYCEIMVTRLSSKT